MVWGLFDNRESFVPTALNHCFTLVYPVINSGAIRSDVPPVLGAIIYGISPPLGFMAVLFFLIPFGRYPIFDHKYFAYLKPDIENRISNYSEFDHFCQIFYRLNGLPLPNR